MVTLNHIVSKAVSVGATYGTSPETLEAANDLDVVLQRHRATFISLLRNPKKSSTERWAKVKCLFVAYGISNQESNIILFLAQSFQNIILVVSKTNKTLILLLIKQEIFSGFFLLRLPPNSYSIYIFKNWEDLRAEMQLLDSSTPPIKG